LGLLLVEVKQSTFTCEMPDFPSSRLGVGRNENIANTGEYGTITAHVFTLELLGIDGFLAGRLKLLLLIESLL